MASKLDDISFRLGALQADMTNLKEDVGRSNDVFGQVSGKVETLWQMIERIEGDVAEMRPAVERLGRWEQRVVGVSAFVSFVVTTIGAVVFSRWKGWT